MYYEEMIINYTLHYRTVPNGEWFPISPERMTLIIMQLRRDIRYHCDNMESLIQRLK